jgi:hypothetical protein
MIFSLMTSEPLLNDLNHGDIENIRLKRKKKGEFLRIFVLIIPILVVCMILIRSIHHQNNENNHTPNKRIRRLKARGEWTDWIMSKSCNSTCNTCGLTKYSRTCINSENGQYSCDCL